MPSATINDVALRSTNPVKRAMDVISVIILQLFTLAVLAGDQTAARPRNRRFVGSDSILVRLEAGETFDLPLVLIASIRSIARSLRDTLRLDGREVTQSGAPATTPPQKAARHRKPTRRRPAPSHRAAPITNHAQPRARRSPNRPTGPPRSQPRTGKTKALHHQRLATFIPLRYRDKLPRALLLQPPPGQAAVGRSALKRTTAPLPPGRPPRVVSLKLQAGPKTGAFAPPLSPDPEPGQPSRPQPRPGGPPRRRRRCSRRARFQPSHPAGGTPARGHARAGHRRKPIAF
jgi:hypothetical protein